MKWRWGKVSAKKQGDKIVTEHWLATMHREVWDVCVDKAKKDRETLLPLASFFCAYTSLVVWIWGSLLSLMCPKKA